LAAGLSIGVVVEDDGRLFEGREAAGGRAALA
jgi:hypothetical protein